MKDHHGGKKYHFFENVKNMKGIWFHLIGLAAIIWFCIRVLPAPHRSRYPCQQVSIVVGLGYIAFWGALFTALRLWLPHARWRASKIAPSIAAVFVVLIMISGVGFTVNFLASQPVQSWDPIPKEPIGMPQGANPGRLVWVWNPDATEDELIGYWWNKENNNQEVIDQMYSDGLQQLAGVDDDYDAWDILFHYFNNEHGKGDVGYQSGEKISIKINMNNGYFGSYTSVYDDVDANPYVVKTLLRQLCDVVGVAEEDITVYDASRKLMNWFYYRAYYEEYPANPLVPEFPDVHFVDMDGGAAGREEVVASDERVYFAAGPCAYRTLPTVVTEADYMINMPITKRHVAERVTLAGKNWFGTWMEDVYSVHTYHTMGFSQMGNPAPQADLVAHERLGGNTMLLIGDGTYACRYGNSDISKFEMYPFNGDWMSSLFFSQDSVALDSVMFDFFMVEGTGGGPSEGAQNYLHQQAEPPDNIYDPENDGEYVSESMGVHEHWDTTENIFSFERYSGLSNNGIDYIAVSEDKLVADAGGPYYGLFNETVQFNGSATGGFQPYTWGWDFGDTHTSEEQNPTHTYTNPGNYNVTLTVTDNGSNTAIDTTYAWIQDGNTPPFQPSIEGPPGGKAGTSYPYTFKATDFEEDLIWYYIDWDDGSNTGWIGPFNSGETITSSHKWDSQGTYTIKAKAKDTYNAESPWGELEVNMPREKATQKPFLNWLENHPNLFLLLQRLVQRLGLQ